MAIQNYTIPEFRDKYLDRLLNDKKKYEFLGLSQLEGYKSSLNYHLDLCLENSERLAELNSEFIRTRNFLRQESSIFISSFLDILPIIERENGHAGIPHNEREYQATHSLKSVGNLIFDDEPIFQEFSFMRHLNLDFDGVERAIAIVIARKQFLDYLKLEIEKMQNPTPISQPDVLSGTDNFENQIFDNSLVKWNKKIYEFYFLIDALEESGYISFTKNNKTIATEQIAKCFGRKLAKSWEISKSGDYRKERPKKVNGKTNIFRDMDLAFNRLIDIHDEINNAKDERDTLVIEGIKARKKQEKTT